jgi:serine/threonine protein kinase
MSDDTTDATLPASGAGASSGTEATMASGPGAPESSPPIVRAGRAEDYDALIGVDPKHYVVGKEIARGGMGRILSARDRRLGRPVAIKELLYESGDARARFEREARITAKLQHPAIVNILEAGAWPTGEPFYVMKLVTGESLDKVIADRATLEARLGLLPNVIAAVDALAYAHSMRVIHRDLKPGNVLVGEFGETVVIDWGLAKDLADTTGTPDLPAGPYRKSGRSAGETVAGAIMGTPAYMPVEQATGEAVDERADVYALGAMLYHVLAGAPPYTGKTSDDVLERVIKGPPPALADRTAGIPPDLVTIVEKAMAHDAADRYPTAKELADDLKKFQTGQLVGAHRYSTWALVRRWIRRHRTPVAVGAIAAIALAVVAIISVQRILREEARTAQQRQAAEKSRGDAEELLGFMLVDLKEKLRPIGKLEILDAVAEKAMAYYDGRTQLASDADRARLATAHTNIAEVLFQRGNLAAALEQFGKALEIREELVTRDPEDGDLQRSVSGAHFNVGVTLEAQGKTAEALSEIRTSLRLAEALAAKDPSRADWARDVASRNERIGTVLLNQGDLAGALGEYRAGLAIIEKLAATDPAKWAKDVGVMRNRVGNVLLTQGDTEGALAIYRSDLATGEARLREVPDDADRLRSLMVSHIKIGDVLNQQGKIPEALAELRLAVPLGEKLAAIDVENTGWQRDLALVYGRVGDLLVMLGEHAEGLEMLLKDKAIVARLVAIDPTNAGWQIELALTHEKSGTALLRLGRTDEALATFRAGLALAEQAVAIDPTNADWQRNLEIDHEKIGEALVEKGDLAGGLAEYRAAQAVAAKLAAMDASNMQWQRDLALTHEEIAGVLRTQRDLAGALADYRTSLPIREMLAAKDRANVRWQRDLMRTEQSIADMLLAQKDARGALAHYQPALAAWEPLRVELGDDPDWQDELAIVHGQIGDAHTALGDAESARGSYQAAKQAKPGR